jgi:toxin ParE1/3/4
MTGHYRVLPAADRDLDEQADYLAMQASLETAPRFYDAASVTFGKIASMPGIGEQWLSANPRLAGLRVWRIEGFQKHLIF